MAGLVLSIASAYSRLAADGITSRNDEEFSIGHDAINVHALHQFIPTPCCLKLNTDTKIQYVNGTSRL